MVLVVAAVGVSGSGKTVTLEYLVSQLSAQGYKIGSIKHVHHKGFTMDKEGTNTWRYAKAGAKVIVAISPEEIDIIRKTEMTLNNVDQITALLKDEDLDIVFIEGFHSLIAKRTDVPKIITAVSENGLKQTLKGTVQPILAIAGIVAENSNSTDYNNIPIIKVPEDGQKLLELVKKQLTQNKTA
ncbi:MAG: molybdopterin-guanine dinucleotide biosynthesis protein B [Candidatus Bathyarchaeia archaeon]|jgi:molybdopterin-guanine dinucleotide biosynthesis protein B